jgi:YVTN family beta-propeller protein
MIQIAISQPRYVLSLYISWFWVLFATVLISCSGGGTYTYTVGGTVSGLTAGSLVLKNNGGDALTIAANSTSFTFATTQVSGTGYSVTIDSQPNGLTCSVSNGSGTIANTSILNATVVCQSQYVYVPNNSGSGSDGSISVFTVDPISGILTALSQPIVTGAGLNNPVAIAISPKGTFAYAVNFFSNTVSMFSVNSSTGQLTALSPATVTTDSSCAPASGNSTAIAIHPAGAFAYITNKCTHSVSMFSINASTGIFSPLSTPSVNSGNFPQRISINPAGTFAYVANFFDDTVTIYSIANNGILTAVNTISAFSGPSQIAFHPGGNYAYVPNYNANSISILDLQNNTVIGSVLTGDGPTQIAINSTGTNAYVVNRNSNAISMYSIVSDGSLIPLSTATIATGTTPVSIGISPSGANVYVSNFDDNTVSMYSINSSTGVLSALSTPVAAGTNPSFIAIK